MSQSMLKADLGPTNTGKTHHAIARLLQFRSGVIGLPLRLLAREVYDKICAQVNPQEVALITGEERIIGSKARYWVATVEAMPTDFNPEIVIIDEVQLCADLERGHIFTDRLLNARGAKETLWLGSHAIRPLLERLYPELYIETRPRLSELSYVGRKKLANLPPRSAIVAFSTEEVYATAEFLRRQHGGAAVVMGALSPRTRNAQVDMFQNGEVDYIVATDAIGMGLNLDLSNVFFAGTEKYDGQRHRSLFPYELAQIAGRAGRFSRDGGFGITASAETLPPETIFAIENHQFAPIRELQWRNSKLNFASIDHLISSLEQPPKSDFFTRTRESDDLRVLRHLSRMQDIQEMTTHPANVEKLWNVCQLPDFPKFAAGEHLRLVEGIYRALRSKHGRIKSEVIEATVSQLARPHHNIEIIARKLAQIRTWAYIAQRNHWLDEGNYWRERTRAVEDQLSDALHQALIESFVDSRTSQLRRRLKEKEVLMAEVNESGEVTIEGQFVGKLSGFQFELDPKAEGAEAKTIASAAQEALAPLFHLRTDKFYNTTDKDISLTEQFGIMWDGATIGNLSKGSNALEPKITVFADDNLAIELKEKIARRLSHWVERRRAEQLAPLLAIRDDETLTGLVRGVAFQLVEAMGVIAREKIANDVKSLSQEDRGLLRKHGVRFGQYSIFVPVLLKPAPTELRMTLSAIWRDETDIVSPPPAGLVTIPADASYAPHHYDLSGYKLVGLRAIRIDMLERLADLLRDKDRRAGFEANPDMLSITGLTLEQFVNVMENIGFAAEKLEREPTNKPTDATEEPVANDVYYIFKGKAPKARVDSKINKKPFKKPAAGTNKSVKPKKVDKPIDPDNPFAALMALKGKN